MRYGKLKWVVVAGSSHVGPGDVTMTTDATSRERGQSPSKIRIVNTHFITEWRMNEKENS